MDRTVSIHEAAHSVAAVVLGPDIKSAQMEEPPHCSIGFSTVATTRVYIEAHIVMTLAARRADAMIGDGVTAAANSDLEAATGMARNLVARWGVGSSVYSHSESEAMPSRDVREDVRDVLERLERGRLYTLNDRLETTAAGVWAIGDCAGSPQFTHVTHDEFRIIRDNLSGGARSTGDRLAPYCVFTDPPLAHIGLSERDALRQGIAVRIGKLPMSAVLRRQATDETQGFMKVLVGAHEDRILGFTMIGADAGEVVAVIQAAMLGGLPYPRLRGAHILQLTTAEGLWQLLLSMAPA